MRIAFRSPPVQGSERYRDRRLSDSWRCLILVACVAHAGFAIQEPNDQEQLGKKPRSIQISVDTTFVTGPLDRHGRVDFVAAVNQKFLAIVPKESNAAVLLIDAFGPCDANGRVDAKCYQILGVEAPHEGGDYFVDIGEFVGDWAPNDSETFRSGSHDILVRPWSDVEFPNVKKWLDRNDAALAKVQTAVLREQYFVPAIHIESADGRHTAGLLGAEQPWTSRCRDVGRALVCRAMLSLGSGELHRAWANLHAAHRLGRLLTQGYSLVQKLTGLAIEKVAVQGELAFFEYSPLSKSMHEECVKQLGALPRRQTLADGMEFAERLTLLDAIQQHSLGNEMLFRYSGDPPAMVQWLAQQEIDWSTVMRLTNLEFDRFHERTHDSGVVERLIAVRKLQSEFDGSLLRLVPLILNQYYSIAMARVIHQLWFPSMLHVHFADARVEQQDINLRTTAALSAYRDEHEGNYPDDLSELVPQFMEQIPQDLFGMRPLTYRREDRGFLLYSIGGDFVDNGGVDEGKLGIGDDLIVRFRK